MGEKPLSITELSKLHGGRRTHRRPDVPLLSNLIRHVDSHNKVVEEKEAWRQWELKQSLHKDRPKTPPPRNQRQVRKATDVPGKDKGYEYTKKLYEFEETAGDRWGHSGFKELHPEVFQDQKSERPEKKRGYDDLIFPSDSDSSDTSGSHGGRRNKRKKYVNEKKKKKKDKKKKEKKKKKRKKSHKRT